MSVPKMVQKVICYLLFYFQFYKNTPAIHKKNDTRKKRNLSITFSINKVRCCKNTQSLFQKYTIYMYQKFIVQLFPLSKMIS